MGMTKLQKAEWHVQEAGRELLWLAECDELLRADELLSEARMILGKLRLAEHRASKPTDAALLAAMEVQS